MRKQHKLTMDTPNGMTITIDKRSDHRNVEMFKKIKIDKYKEDGKDAVRVDTGTSNTPVDEAQ